MTEKINPVQEFATQNDELSSRIGKFVFRKFEELEKLDEFKTIDLDFEI